MALILPFTEAEAVIVGGTFVSIVDRYVLRPDQPLTRQAGLPMKTNTDDGSTFLRRMTAAALSVVFSVVVAFACLALTGSSIACNDAAAAHKGSTYVRYPDGSEFRSSEDSSAVTHGPSASTQPTAATADGKNAQATSSGTWGPLPKSMTDYAGEKLWLFYAGAILSVLGAVFSFTKAHPIEGIAFVIAAVGLALTPTLLVGFEAISTEAAVALIALAAILLIGRKLGSVREKAKQGVATVQVAMKQAAAGEWANAVGTLESHPDIKPLVTPPAAQ